jgi:hypothetical protein
VNPTPSPNPLPADPQAARLDLKSRALAAAPPAHHSAIAFLIDHMPAADLHTLSPDFLHENVSLAYEARSTFLWATQIPEPIFFNEVLPYAVLDEPRENWRRILLEKFRPIASSAKTARDAMSLINAAIRSETGVIYHTARRAPNQGPLESIESGMASCTGLSILLIDALRAVGLPARIVGTHWTTMPGNHSWVEVWLPETQTWALTEYTPHRDGLDHAWFIPDAARAIPGNPLHGVFASTWQRADETHFPLAWNLGDRSLPAIDVTDRYIALGRNSLPGPGECALRIEAIIAGLEGSESRRPTEIEVRCDGAVVARGISPSTEDDMNQFLYLIVKNGRIYQVVSLSHGAVLASAEIATDGISQLWKLSLTVPPPPNQP